MGDTLIEDPQTFLGNQKGEFGKTFPGRTRDDDSSEVGVEVYRPW